MDTHQVLELVQRQRRASLRYFVAILGPLIVFAFALYFVPPLRSWRPLGLLPLPWLVLGPISLFSIVVLAFFHERTALRIERAWASEHADGRRRNVAGDRRR